MSKYQDVIRKLNLIAHPVEGGFYRRNYTAKVKAFFPNLGEERSLASAIFYLFGEKSLSYPHYLKQDELWHFYSGSPVELLLLPRENKPELIIMGSDILNGHKSQVTILAGTIFCARMLAGGEYSLIGATLSPAFEMGDYHDVDCSELIKKYPQHKEFLTGFLH
ncbi:cupin domain-containing protein [bacterium]|nr:cupin domain-containing protein [bacterium]